MGESRQFSSDGGGAVLRKPVPPPALCGFFLLLVLVFAPPYDVVQKAGSVAPGMHGTNSTGGDGSVDGTEHGHTGGG